MTTITSNPSNTSSTPAASTNGAYYDLHTYCTGYLDDVRDVSVRKGSFMACRFSALRAEGDTGTTRFDLKVVGAHAKSSLEQVRNMKGNAVVSHVKIGDIYPEMFHYTSGARAGEIGCNIKGRLIRVYAITVDGQQLELPPMPDGASPAAKDDVPTMLTTTGVGYLNDVRRISKGENEFTWVCSIAALRGDGNEIETTRFGLALGPDSIDDAIALHDAVKSKKKVLVKFEAASVRPEVFQYKKGDKAGQYGVAIKGSLKRLAWAKVDGTKFVLPSDLPDGGAVQAA